jgi:hypothetical protein
MTNASDDDNLPDFSGKVVTFYCVNEPPEGAVALISPTFAKQGGRIFALGQLAPDQSGRWDDGLQSAVAWDQVNNYVIFPSLEVYRSRVAAFYARSTSG